MKKEIRNLLGVALVAGLTATCSTDDGANSGNDIIVDYAPVVISVKVLSPEGYSVLNAQNTQGISAVYKDESYVCQSQEAAMRQALTASTSRYYMPHFYGLCYLTDYLLFGELDGAKDYKDEKLILYWGGDQKPDTITFSLTHKSNSNPDKIDDVEYQQFLNGQPVTGQITLYKDLPEKAAVNDSTPRKQMPIKDEWRQLISGVNHFGMNLFRQMVQEKQTESLVASPLSVAYLLGMVANGVPENSQTLMEIDKALRGLEKNDDPSISVGGCYSYSAQPFNDLFQTLITWAPQVDSRVTLELADALFTDNNFPVYAGYVNLLAQYYQADYAKLDFASPEAVTTINNWCSQKTHGLIPEMVKEIPPYVVAYLFNALYFKAPWQTKFEAENTRWGEFTRPDGTKQSLPLMHSTLETLFARTEQYTAVSLPFAKGAYTMDILLPAQGMSVSQLAQDVDFQNIGWFRAEVNLTLPRFEVKSAHDDLKSLLQALGVQRIFTSTAGFTELSPVEDLYISRIFQKARIIINEEGGEAAAITGAEFVVETALGDFEVFTANRPFLYCIREESSGVIFFLGTYCGDGE